MVMDDAILLVEDQPADVELITKALRRRGFQNAVRVIERGQEAVRYLSEHPAIRFVLLDLNLPDVSGIEVLSMLDALDLLRDFIVVVLTASDSDHDFLAVDQYRHSVTFVSKTGDMMGLTAVLRSLGLQSPVASRAPWKP